MGGEFLIGIAKEHREPAVIKNQKETEVALIREGFVLIGAIPYAGPLLAIGIGGLIASAGLLEDLIVEKGDRIVTLLSAEALFVTLDHNGPP